MTGFMQGGAQDVDVGVRGFASLNNGLRTMPVESDFSVGPGAVDPARDVVVSPQTDPVAYEQSEGRYTVTGQQVSFETAKLVKYFPGGLQIAGQLIMLPSVPSEGHVDVGLGRVPFDSFDGTAATFNRDTSEVLLRLDSDGDFSYVIRRNGVDTVIPRDGPGGSWSGAKAERSWAGDTAGAEVTNEDGDHTGYYYPFDDFSGDGPSDVNPSGFDIDPPVGVLVKFFGTYYGKGPYFLCFNILGPGGYQRPYPAVGFVARDDQTVTTRASQPLMARYNDDGAGNTYSFGVGGRQGSHTGDFSEDPITPFDLTTGVDVSAGTDPANADCIMAYRRKPQSAAVGSVDYRGAGLGLLKVATYNDQRILLFLCLDPDFGQTPDWSDADVPTADGDTVAVQTATQDTTGADLTADPSTGRSFAGDIAGQGRKDADVTGLSPEDQPTPRTKPVGVFALSLTGVSTSGSEFLLSFKQS